MAVVYHCARCRSLATPNQTLLIVYHHLGLPIGLPIHNGHRSIFVETRGLNLEPIINDIENTESK